MHPRQDVPRSPGSLKTHFSTAALIASTDWDRVRLIVFDVDGTLYRKRPLRLRMARNMLLRAAVTCDTKVFRAIGQYRRIRECRANDQARGFDRALIEATTRVTSNPPQPVCQIVSEWIDRRPLQYLSRCLYHNVPEVFAGLQRHGMTVGVFSDDPAKAKIDAKELVADHVVTAGDTAVDVLKPHQKSLKVLMATAGAGPQEAVMIGDRPEGGGLLAQRVGVRALIRSSRQ